jgi:16S rRNA (uracil1498-N3)-methyltransferase
MVGLQISSTYHQRPLPPRRNRATSSPLARKGRTSEKISLFSLHQWRPVTLGPRILHAETVAIPAIAIASTHLT